MIVIVTVEHHIQVNGLYSYSISVIFNTKLDVTKYISVQRDSNGKIVGASAMQMTWIGKVDLDSAQGSNSNAGTGLPVDEDSLEFEELIYNVFDEIRIDLEKRDVATIYINVARGIKGFADVALPTIDDSFQDTTTLPPNQS